MIKILSIGNSYSQDAHALLHRLCSENKIQVKTVNLYIGGCTLETHYNNILSNCAAYEYEINGQSTASFISISKALAEEEWDFVTMQQASYLSGIDETYYPYIEKLNDYVAEHCKTAKRYLMQTWAYEVDSDHGGFANYQYDQNKMHNMLKRAYSGAAEKLGISQILCGDVIQELRKTEGFRFKEDGFSLCRDGFHMNIPYGRYALSAAFFQTLLKKDILQTNINIDADKGKISQINHVVHDICAKNA